MVDGESATKEGAIGRGRERGYGESEEGADG